MGHVPNHKLSEFWQLPSSSLTTAQQFFEDPHQEPAFPPSRAVESYGFGLPPTSAPAGAPLAKMPPQAGPTVVASLVANNIPIFLISKSSRKIDLIDRYIARWVGR